jgi:POT family proton-dependent oligopeptide transporter
MSLFKREQPKSFYILSLGELCESLSYYGLQAIFVLYLSKVYLYSDNRAYSLFGVFVTLAFSAPLLGGILADRLIGRRQTIILGAISLIIGNLLLSITNFKFFCLGIANIIYGTGLYKANCTSLIGTLYKKNDTRRLRGFTLFYMATNIGAMAGPLIYGFTQKLGWGYGFIFSAVSISISLIFFLKQFPDDLVEIKTVKVLLLPYYNLNRLIYLAQISVTLLLGILFYYNVMTEDFITIFIITMIVILVISLLKKVDNNHGRILSLLILCFFAMIFFAITLQVVTSINLFIQRNVDRNLGGWNVPTVMFSALYPMAVITMAPLITGIWQKLSILKKEPSVLVKIFFGLVLAGVGFICFALAATESISFHYYPLALIVIGNLFLGTGELCLMPSILSAISRFAPKSLTGTLMGALFLFIAFAGYLSSVIAKLSTYIHPPISILMTKNSGAFIYSQFFKDISLLTFGCALLFLILLPLINLIMKEN